MVVLFFVYGILRCLSSGKQNGIYYSWLCSFLVTMLKKKSKIMAGERIEVKRYFGIAPYFDVGVLYVSCKALKTLFHKLLVMCIL